VVVGEMAIDFADEDAAVLMAHPFGDGHERRS